MLRQFISGLRVGLDPSSEFDRGFAHALRAVEALLDCDDGEGGEVARGRNRLRGAAPDHAPMTWGSLQPGGIYQVLDDGAPGRLVIPCDDWDGDVRRGIELFSERPVYISPQAEVVAVETVGVRAEDGVLTPLQEVPAGSLALHEGDLGVVVATRAAPVKKLLLAVSDLSTLAHDNPEVAVMRRVA